jgi:hypothetical protein
MYSNLFILQICIEPYHEPGTVRDLELTAVNKRHFFPSLMELIFKLEHRQLANQMVVNAVEKK